ncbi:MAG TPA: hypothetical protein VF666_01840 [Pyrinomonadaceae bacterium]|jgi:hypothetical protein
MSPADILSRLRRFLLVLSVSLFGGAVLELWLVNHTEDAVQLIPFVLCGFGSLAALAALFRPRRATVWCLRVCMLLVLCGALFGIYEHVENNIAFEREINPAARTGDVLWSALGGANPLLAPGVLAVAAILSLAAAYRHPATSEHEETND